MTKKILLFFLVFIILFGTAELVFIQPSVGRNLEIEYPEVAGEQPEKVITPVPEYVRYIYNALIWLSGLIALIVLIIGGSEWFTSAGDIDRIRSAKDRISAAVLGIIILIGSYLILVSINPELVVFHLPRLRPIISELTPGVLVCRGVVGAQEAWDLTEEFKYGNPNENREKEIKERIDLISENISEKCYYVQGEGNIRPDLDNKIVTIYFIPLLTYKYDEPSKTYYVAESIQYGAVVYEENNFKGKSKVFWNQLFSPKKLDIEPVYNLSISSIKPFVRENIINWQVSLYQYYDFNRELENPEPFEKWEDLTSVTSNIGGPYPLTIPPKSIKIEGQALAILFKKEQTETFLGPLENNNLENNENIVEWVKCKEYQAGQKCEQIWYQPPGAFGGYYISVCNCPEAAADGIIILSGTKPLL